jgi:hypothetical protein
VTCQNKETLLQVRAGFSLFPQYHTKLLLEDFNAKLGREDLFKLTIGNKRLHQDCNNNGVRIVNFAHQKNLFGKSIMLPLQNIHKYSLLIGTLKIRLITY